MRRRGPRLNGAGFSDAKITILFGEEGVHLLKRLEGFFFSDAELGLIKFSEQQLRLGHYGLGVEVELRDDAVRVAKICTPRAPTVGTTSAPGSTSG